MIPFFRAFFKRWQQNLQKMREKPVRKNLPISLFFWQEK